MDGLHAALLGRLGADAELKYTQGGLALLRCSVCVKDTRAEEKGEPAQWVKVILGYCNHQMLAAASAGANAIASGTWMNVRSFPPEKFRTAYEDEIKRKTTWYYCPQALSEYKIPTLDIAMLQGVLQDMEPPPEMGSHFADILFQGAQPSTVGFGETLAFRHYLKSLHAQVEAARRPTFVLAVTSATPSDARERP